MDGHGQPALLYIVPFTLGKYNHLTHKFESVNTYSGILFFNVLFGCALLVVQGAFAWLSSTINMICSHFDLKSQDDKELCWTDYNKHKILLNHSARCANIMPC
jgi:hypothetical protein